MTPAEPELLERTTALLRRVQDGEQAASDELFRLLYDELKLLARRQLAHVPGNVTLQPTALVHELWLRLRSAQPLDLESRRHFMCLAARAMRRVVVDHLRRRGAAKRRLPADAVLLDAAISAWHSDQTIDPLVLDDLLTRLRDVDPRLADTVELRFFGGLSEVETAEVLGLTRRQIQHGWRLARAWLQRELLRSATDGAEPPGSENR